ncbi:MAG: hypothetical protein HYT13_00620, partial [Candidatus Liptonbacteria bacterium]|nr:hypothetical protein [Candidatus Liptonbacteria bacterium]
MPKQILPDAAAFARFRAALIKRGFREVSSVEFRKDFSRLKLKAPSPREGREVGFRFWANSLEVKVWTTFLSARGRSRESDAGWVLILDGDEAQYFSHPLRRTKNFLHNLLWFAGIAKWRVEHRPLCPVCKKYMRIRGARAFRAKLWECVSSTFHKDPVRLSWDYELPQWAMDFLRPFRRRRARYYAKLRAEGKAPGEAARRR